MKSLLIATNNAGKLNEITDLLKGYPLHLLAPKDLGLDLDVDETGSTYEANARLKGLAFAQAAGMAALADDTGLEVDALGGAPGLHSKRYAPHPGATDADRRQLLIRNLAQFPQPWLARFTCCMVLALPDGSLQVAHGACTGEIIPEERGTRGFGYDSIFLFPQLAQTMSEVDLEVKNRLSHRARAVLNIRAALEAYIQA
jgi:XTP/dITP diphosphohydrolase